MIKKILLPLYHYFCFFLLMAFVITCCTMLFVSTMQSSMGIEFTEENINTAAKLTFWNVALISLAGITVGLVGMVAILAAYPLYQYISEKKRKKIAPEILRLTDELMNEGK